MEFAKISPRKVSDQLAEHLKEQILAGRLPPGAKLPSTRELSDRYAVGRSTVREALSALKAMGLIETRHGEGSFVCRFSAERVALPRFEGLLADARAVAELLEARKVLETGNAALAAEKRTDEDLRAFEDVLARMERSIGDEGESERADLAFHRLLAEATHNALIVRMFETFSAQLETAIREIRRLQMYANPKVSERLYREHRDIFEAVRAGHPERAVRAMRRHLFHVESVLIRVLQA